MDTFITFLTENDRLGKSCVKCKSGKYKEMDFHDDMDGVVRCPNNKCKHYTRPINRHKSDDKENPMRTHKGHDRSSVQSKNNTKNNIQSGKKADSHTKPKIAPDRRPVKL